MYGVKKFFIFHLIFVLHYPFDDTPRDLTRSINTTDNIQDNGNKQKIAKLTMDLSFM